MLFMRHFILLYAYIIVILSLKAHYNVANGIFPPELFDDTLDLYDSDLSIRDLQATGSNPDTPTDPPVNPPPETTTTPIPTPPTSPPTPPTSPPTPPTTPPTTAPPTTSPPTAPPTTQPPTTQPPTTQPPTTQPPTTQPPTTQPPTTNPPLEPPTTVTPPPTTGIPPTTAPSIIIPTSQPTDFNIPTDVMVDDETKNGNVRSNENKPPFVEIGLIIAGVLLAILIIAMIMWQIKPRKSSNSIQYVRSYSPTHPDSIRMMNQDNEDATAKGYGNSSSQTNPQAISWNNSNGPQYSDEFSSKSTARPSAWNKHEKHGTVQFQDAPRDSHESAHSPGERLTVSDDDDHMLEEVLSSLRSNLTLQAYVMNIKEIQFGTQIGIGAFGEVWKCQYRYQPIAVKRLLASKMRDAEVVRDFVSEIILTASLDHPNIIAFQGVSWNNSENLCMAIEYLPRGDLWQFLQSDGDMLPWVRGKLPMAIGVAKALTYMHGRTPPVLHRDLKTKNVMLTEHMDVKIIDFGVSRIRIDRTMTAAVGTPYWAAPEVLDSKRYDEKSDIYSFGIFLSELDTCEIPYHDVRTEEGERMTLVRVLQKVCNGELSPSFTPDCPMRIVTLAKECLQVNPSDRPSAAEVLNILTGVVSYRKSTASGTTQYFTAEAYSNVAAPSDTIQSALSDPQGPGLTQNDLSSHEESTGYPPMDTHRSDDSYGIDDTSRTSYTEWIDSVDHNKKSLADQDLNANQLLDSSGSTDSYTLRDSAKRGNMRWNENLSTNYSTSMKGVLDSQVSDSTNDNDSYSINNSSYHSIQPDLAKQNQENDYYPNTGSSEEYPSTRSSQSETFTNNGLPFEYGGKARSYRISSRDDNNTFSGTRRSMEWEL